MSFKSTKVIPLGSCAFRQPLATSHCAKLHGYRLQAKFWFSCDQLDNNNWVVDFGSLKELKVLLEQTFDHKTAISATDPDLEVFKELEMKGIIDLVIFPKGVGIERFAEFCFEQANIFVGSNTAGRCWCSKVEIWEHEGNSAIYESSKTEWKS